MQNTIIAKFKSMAAWHRSVVNLSYCLQVRREFKPHQRISMFPWANSFASLLTLRFLWQIGICAKAHSLHEINTIHTLCGLCLLENCRTVYKSHVLTADELHQIKYIKRAATLHNYQSSQLCQQITVFAIVLSYRSIS